MSHLPQDLVDPKTGEPYRVTVHRNRNRQARDFVMGYQDGHEKLAKTTALTARDYRILHMLLARMSYENYLPINQAEIADELNIHAPDVSKTFKKLHALGFIETEGKKKGRSITYRLAKMIAWKGAQPVSLEKARKRAALQAINTDEPKVP